MNQFSEDPHLDVCQNIEAALVQCYRRDDALTDLVCEFALDNAKFAIKQQFGFAQNERVSQSESVAPIVALCTQIGMARIGKFNNLTLKEYVARLDKIKTSVRRHSSAGACGYYEFLSPFMPDDRILWPTDTAFTPPVNPYFSGAVFDVGWVSGTFATMMALRQSLRAA